MRLDCGLVWNAKLCFFVNFMQKIIRSKIDTESRKTVAEDLKGYIKVVVDIRRQILSTGGEKHVDAEQLLLKDGSCQEDLWGAGLDLETNEMDFDSLINLRPNLKIVVYSGGGKAGSP